jgi:hypothetical protein
MTKWRMSRTLKELKRMFGTAKTKKPYEDNLTRLPRSNPIRDDIALTMATKSIGTKREKEIAGKGLGA